MKKLFTLLILAVISTAMFSQNTNRITDLNNRIAGIDASTWSMQTIMYEHHEIHSGSHYYIEDFTTLASVGDSVMFAITTPDTTKWAHMVFSHESTVGGYYFNVYEASTYSSGTAYTKVYNNNRNSTNTSGLVIVTNPTVTVLGTHLIRQSLGNTTNPNKGDSGGSERSHELVLKQNTKYLFVFKTKTNANDITFDARWYEHKNKE